MLYTIIIFLVVCCLSIRIEPHFKTEKLSYKNTLNLRGLLTIIIILHHFAANCDLRMPNGMQFLLLPHMGYLCVAVFFFLSGYGLQQQYEKNGKQYIYRIYKKIVFFILIFIGVNIIYLLLSPLYSDLNYSDSSSIFIKGLVNGLPIAGPSWYLIDLSLLYITFTISKKVKKDIICLLLFQIPILLFYKIMNYGDIWIISNLAFPIGSIFAKRSNMLSNFSRIKAISLLTITLISFLIFSILPIYIDILRLPSRLLSSLSFSIFSVLVFITLTFKNNIFSWIGQYSLEVFLLHVLVYKVLRGGIILYIDSDFIFSVFTIGISLLLAIPMSKADKAMSSLIMKI